MAGMRVLALLAALLLVAPRTAVSQDYDGEDYPDYYDEDDYGGGGAPGGDVDESDVVVLTSANFAETLANNKFALVEFYAPWCGHCQQLAPQYAAAATLAKEADSGLEGVVVAKLDATAEEELAAEFGIEGYPTIKFFVDGVVKHDYAGGHATEDILSFLQKRTGPPAATVADAAEMQVWIEKVDADALVVAVGSFAEFAGAEWDAFQSVAMEIDNVAFVQTTSADAAKVAGVEAKAPALTLLRSFEEKRVAFDGAELTEEALGKFVRINRMPSVIAFDQDSAQDIFGSGIDTQVLMFGLPDDDAEADKVEEAFFQAAQKFRGQIVFVTVDTEVEENAQVLEFFGVAAGATPPTVVAISMGSDEQDEEPPKKYRLPEAFSQAAMESFCAAILDGSAKPYFKSEPVPESNDEPVTVVVGDNFDAVVLDATKDVLLEVYAPWCGHCKQLEPHYNKLGKRFKSINSVVIAKMDGTANEHSRVSVQGFPTIMFFPAEADAVAISYEDARTLPALTKFIKQNAKIPYELKKKASADASEGSDDAAEHDEL